MVKKHIIGVSGESGVGKTTISKIISLFYGVGNTTNVSTDDLHKWDRKNEMWDKITHCNPDANNLELGDTHLNYFLNNKPIYRSVYNHDTGYFNAPIKIEPKDIIIIDGLHAFYSDFSVNNINLKIYVDTDEVLRTHWKIIRDTEERGYKYSTVLDTINKRKIDSNVIREKQINCADVVISLKPSKPILRLGDKNEEIDVEMSFSFATKLDDFSLFDFIKKYNDEFTNFIKYSEEIGNNLDFCQNGGGNISTKINDKYMLIKASGYNMKDAYRLKAYSLIDYSKVKTSLISGNIKNDNELNTLILESVISDKIPSMETGFHVLLDKYVIHTHPIYLTTILCLENSKDIIKLIYSDYDYEYIDFVNPAFDLYEVINKTKKNKKIYFLENHGIIVTSNNIRDLINLFYDINNISKKYINDLGFKDFNLSFSNKLIGDKYPFPDSVIFSNDISKKEILAAHNYVITCGTHIGNLRYLEHNNLYKLKNMKSEKYRKTV
jgi:uridine kinase/ribulose-5-phosphate 4-epimerase/fuculose-1-phosphate aldolase